MTLPREARELDSRDNKLAPRDNKLALRDNGA